MFNFGRTYHAAMRELAKLESRYRKSLEALDQALTEGRRNDVPGLRKAVGSVEREVRMALQAATIAHRDYWHSRRLELEPQLRQAGVLMHRYDRIARAEGIHTVHPALSGIQDFFADAGVQPDIIDDEDAVPIESPDCELLGDHMGAWRYK